MIYLVVYETEIKMKHAYLIIAHNQFEHLKLLVSALDSENNGIFVHVDKKAINFETKKILDVVKHSSITLIEKPISVIWGDYSQIQVELMLLKEAVKGKYDYYHLLSGVDFPIKNQEQIDTFFSNNFGKEFIHFDSSVMRDEYMYRITKYHLIRGRKKSLLKRIIYKFSILLQFAVNRSKSVDLIFQKGANWFSITDDLANYVISKELLIQKIFKYTLCADEVFLQTLVYNSDYRGKVYLQKYSDNYDSIVRMIDWNRGNPYVYRKKDYEELIRSDKLFARKFDLTIDHEIVDMLYKYVKQNHNDDSRNV